MVKDLASHYMHYFFCLQDSLFGNEKSQCYRIFFSTQSLSTPIRGKSKFWSAHFCEVKVKNWSELTLLWSFIFHETYICYRGYFNLIVGSKIRGTTPQSYRRQRGTRYDSPKLIVGSEVRGTTPQSQLWVKKWSEWMMNEVVHFWSFIFLKHIYY